MCTWVFLHYVVNWMIKRREKSLWNSINAYYFSHQVDDSLSGHQWRWIVVYRIEICTIFLLLRNIWSSFKILENDFINLELLSRTQCLFSQIYSSAVHSRRENGRFFITKTENIISRTTRFPCRLVQGRGNVYTTNVYLCLTIVSPTGEN